MGQISSFRQRYVIPWDIETANFNLMTNRGAFCNSAGTIQAALPTSSEVGDVIGLIGVGGFWEITQSAGQQIIMVGASTTIGSGGTVTSTNVGDGIYLVCYTANLTWYAWSISGVLTVV